MKIIRKARNDYICFCAIQYSKPLSRYLVLSEYTAIFNYIAATCFRATE